MNAKKILISLMLVVIAIASVGAVYAQQGGPGDGGPGEDGPGGRGRGERFPLLREVINVVAEETGLEPADIMEQVRAGSTLADIITANGGDVAAVTTAAVDAVTTSVNDAVTAGELTQEQADRILENVEERVTGIINGDVEFGGEGGPVDGGPRGGMRRGLEAARILVNATAEATGLEAQDIVQQVRDGSTLADIITANGGDVDAVVDAAVAAATEEINNAVTEGRLTQEEADTMIASLETTFTDLVNGNVSLEVRRFVIGREILQLAAEQTGLSVQEIREQYRAGNSLASILEANGVVVSEFIDLAVAQAEERLDQAVENGRLTQEEADARLEEFRTGLTERINEVPAPEAQSA